MTDNTAVLDEAPKTESKKIEVKTKNIKPKEPKPAPVAKPLDLDSVKLDHKIIYTGTDELVESLKGQLKICAQAVKELGPETTKKAVVQRVHEKINGTTKQNGIIVFNYYQQQLIAKGILELVKIPKVVKEKAEPKEPKKEKIPAAPGK